MDVGGFSFVSPSKICQAEGMIFAHQLLGQPVIDRSSNQAVAQIKNIQINPEDGRLTLLMVRAPQLWPRRFLFIRAEDVLSWAPESITVPSARTVRTKEDIAQQKQVPPKRTKILGLLAETATGQPLGKVVDLEIDENGLAVVNFICQTASLPYLNQVMPKRILPWERVIRLTDRAIIFDVDPSQPATASSLAIAGPE